ncbi:MAG: hypothetical protein WAZ18_00830, partial [Alphaproteobacteria bacterium]
MTKGLQLFNWIAEHFPNAKRNKNQLIIGSIKGEKGRSMIITRKPDGAILWYDHATGEGGNALSLVQSLSNCSRKEAILHVRSQGGFDIPTAPAPEKKPSLKNQRRIEKTWSETVAACDPQAEPLRLYLKNRGLGDIVSSIPPSLRFHPKLYFWNDNLKKVQYFPAMVAQIVDWRGNMESLHRTYIT